MRNTVAFHLILLLFVFTAYPDSTSGDAPVTSSDYDSGSNGVLEIEEPEVSFLAITPVVDGILDKWLRELPVRHFSYIHKDQPDNPDIRATYRLAYGINFLYIFIEVQGEKITFRDRAYQFGDGFHMILTNPRVEDELSDEFQLLAFSAANNPRQERFKLIKLLFDDGRVWPQLLGAESSFEFNVDGGKLGFELILSWKDVHPFHPLISEGIGFNLCFVKAVGEESYNLFFVKRDLSMMLGESAKAYIKLAFQTPGLKSGYQTFMLVDRNNVTEGEPITLKAVVVSSSPAEEGILIQVMTGEGYTAHVNKSSYDCGIGVNCFESELGEIAGLPSGGYKIEWSSQLTGSRAETFLTVLPEFDLVELMTRLDEAKVRIAKGSFTTLRFLIEETEKKLRQLRPYETCGSERLSLVSLLNDIQRVEAGEDPYANITGILRRAFRSTLDDSLQPYCVDVPAGYDPSVRYPLLVVLHGQAADETNITGFSKLNPGGFVVLAPRGRGTSNAFSRDNAQTDISEAIDDVLRNYSVDTDNIFLAGFSMGGYGVYRTFYETPDRFQGLIVLSGHPNLANLYFPGENHPNFIDESYLKPFDGIPIFVFHGQADKNCPFEETVTLVRMLREAGAKVEFVVEEGKGHEPPGEETLEKYYEWLDENLKSLR